MKVSIDWLSDYVKINETGEEVADILSDLGFPLEGIEKIGEDTVLDIEVTSNRGDCLCHIGVAREIAAATGRELKLPEITLPESDRDISEFVTVQIEKPELCNRYTARIILGAKTGPSPDWMKDRLEAIGIRSVNNIVDATNYAMLETGQPPHAFDYDKLDGNKIIVRNAVKGERIVSIDETKCNLEDYMLVIANENKPVAIAGIMGGLDTEIDDSTSTILLEDAHFDPVTVRTTSRKLTIGSESSFRFERHVDTEMIDWASKRTAQLITQVAGGTVAKGVVDEYPTTRQTITVAMRLSRLKKLLGIDVPKDEIISIFDRLMLSPEIKGDEIVICSPPTWRHDIYREIDLIEEVARSHGYDKIPTETKIHIPVAAVDKREKLNTQIRSFLNGCGFYETLNITFVDGKTAGLFSDVKADDYLGVKDASRKSANLLRQSLMGPLLNVMKTNYNSGNTSCMVYEIANTFKPQTDGLPAEKTKVAIASDGDFRQLRGVIEGLVRGADSQAVVELKPAELTWASSGADILINGSKEGVCGIISEKTAKTFEIKDKKICLAEIDFDTLLAISGGVVTLKQIPRFPAVTRDLSLIVNEEISWANITEAIGRKSCEELEDVRFSGIYRGKPIPSGKKSITISLRFRDEEGTLRHEAVDKFESDILGELTSSLKAELRTA
jgi:phenylalanyl-tRNA synthetase beta chain